MTLINWRSLAVMLAFASILTPRVSFAQAVTTYHNDTLRTGWNPSETSLTVANVGNGSFNLQKTIQLDGQVDAQPLVVPNQVIGSQGSHTVVYVVTGGNTVYAIDGITGAPLLSRYFGMPVPESTLPGQCNNNGPTVGITSTPVINTATGIMYLIADTYENGRPVYRVHGISLSTLTDAVTPVVVTASAKLADGSVYNFNPAVSRQRAALLLSGSTLFAAFSSYCDFATNTSRGWLLGWNTPNLAPLAKNNLTDKLPTSPAGYYLNSIWMSGYGPSTASANNTVYVVTSNSDMNSYGLNNLDESVLKLSADLSGVQSFFTDADRANLDKGDADLGSGGAMLPPYQPGRNPKLLLAAGKTGTMYLFDRSAASGLGLLGTYAIGGCWCGPSYFQGSDGIGRVVSSGGNTAMVWRLNTSAASAASLTLQSATPISSGQEGGFFTSVSSNGTASGTAIVWAVGRPTQVPGTVPLYGIDPSSGKVIYAYTAGNWVSGNSNVNAVPTIANGHVYVATYQELSIFGLGSPASANSKALTFQRRGPNFVRPFSLREGEHAVWGVVRSVNQTELILQTRKGNFIRVYLPTARAAGNLAAPVPGRAAVAIGKLAANGLLVATSVAHAKPSSLLWPADQ